MDEVVTIENYLAADDLTGRRDESDESPLSHLSDFTDPEHTLLVIDEAHSLENAATDAVETHVDYGLLEEATSELLDWMRPLPVGSAADALARHAILENALRRLDGFLDNETVPRFASRAVSRVDLAACLLAAADAVEARRDELGRLDAVAGDGDHGLTMTLTARAVRQAIEHNPGAAPADLIVKVAGAMGSVGGAIGPIYAAALLKIAGVVRGREAADGPVTVVELRACAEAAATAIAALGHAKPGDKTILDALVPLAESLRGSETDGSPVDAALVRASEAAHAGAEDTAGMIASIGRAARLGEQSRGTADAGATSFAVIVAAAVAAYLSPDRAQLAAGEG